MAEAPGATELAAWMGGNIDAAFEGIGVPAWVIDRKGIIRWENKRGRELFGDFRGRPFTDPIAPEAQEQVRVEFLKKMLGTAHTTDYESVFRTKRGERIPLEVHTVAIPGGKHVVGVFGIAAVERERPPPLPLGADITPRQFEVLRALARGCSTAQLAAELNLSRETVRNHVRGLFHALGVHSRLEAVAEGRRRGLIR